MANSLGHIFPEAERLLEYQASKVIGVDIEGTDRIKIQCKNHQNYCSVGTIHEIRATRSDDIPVLVTKGNRLDPMAVLPFDKFVKLLEIAYGLELPFRQFDTAQALIDMKPKHITATQAIEACAGRTASFSPELIESIKSIQEDIVKSIGFPMETIDDIQPSGNWQSYEEQTEASIDDLF